MVCPDKFRGSLTAPAAADAFAAGVERAGWSDVRRVPLADGGEGTLDALLGATGGRRRRARVTGPLGDRVEAEYGLLPGATAVVEMARASGLALVEGVNRPLDASTRGTGELISAAIRAGARRVIVGVGGSATTDGGLGAVEALGARARGVELVVACDVTTPFLDAARRFGAQKGASSAEVELLTRRLERLADDYLRRTGVDVRWIPGSGAAGGLAGGLAAIGARLEPGFDVVADVAGLDDALEGAALAVTGEGTVDAASFEGKVVGGVVERAIAHRVECVGIIAGTVAFGGIPAEVEVRSLVDRAFDPNDAIGRAALLAEEAAFDLATSAWD